ncbi:MAG: T9SS type A sorting domain-containing protein [Bacteroidota bacterium]
MRNPVHKLAFTISVLLLWLGIFFQRASAQTGCPAPYIAYCPGQLQFCEGTDTIKIMASPGYLNIASYAGSYYGNIDSSNLQAHFREPTGILRDAAGNTFITDYLNNALRKVSPGGTVSTITGGGRFNYTSINLQPGRVEDKTIGRPEWIAQDSAGNTYLTGTDYYGVARKIFRISAAGDVSIFGAGFNGYHDDTLGAAIFNNPAGMATDNAGNLYIADQDNHCIRKVSPAGTVSTFAGTGTQRGYEDGPAATAKFARPTNIAFDVAGNMYVTDNLNYRIRKISPDGMVSTLAGSGTVGSVNGQGTDASFSDFSGLAIEPGTGNIFISEGSRHIIRKITPEGLVSTFAGQVNRRGMTNAAGTAAQFNNPAGLAFTPTGELLVADRKNNLIRMIAVNGNVSTWAGEIYSGLKNGTAEQATFTTPGATAVDAAGNLYVADAAVIRKITPEGMVSNFAGNGSLGTADGLGEAARLQNIHGMHFDSQGLLWVSDDYVLRTISPAGLVTTVCGTKRITDGIYYRDGPAAQARLNPGHFTIDAEDNKYFFDYGSYVRKLSADGIVSTLAGNGTDGYADGRGSAATFLGYSETSIAMGPGGYLYTSSPHLRRISPEGDVLTISNIADSLSGYNYYNPCGAAGNDMLFTANGDMVLSSAGWISILPKNGGGSYSFLAMGPSEEPGSSLFLRNVQGMAIDRAGTIFMTDLHARRVLKGTYVPATGYLWNNGQTGRTLQVSTDGQYSVSYIYGTCTSAFSEPVSVPMLHSRKPELSFDGDLLYSNEIADTIYWYLDGVLIQSGPEPSITLNGNGVYTARCAYTYGCPTPLSEPFIFTGVSNLSRTSSLSIVPNPSGRYVHIAGAEADASVRIINTLGQIVQTEKPGSEGNIDLQNLPAGVYEVCAGLKHARLVKSE